MALPNVDEVEPLILASNGEHDVQILSAKEFVSQKGRTCNRLTLRVLDEEDADDVQAMVFYPADEDDTKDARRFATEVKKFQTSFGLNGGEEPEDIVGAVGRATLKQGRNRQTGEDESQVTAWI